MLCTPDLFHGVLSSQTSVFVFEAKQETTCVSSTYKIFVESYARSLKTSPNRCIRVTC